MAGVIITTAFIHLLDPAYAEIGPQTCVGMTGRWASYSWIAGIVLTSAILVLLLDFAAERFVEVKYGYTNTHTDVEGIITEDGGSFTASIVAGVLDATSAGILIYNGLVEPLASGFIFNPERTRDISRLTFMIVCLFLGTGLTALLAKGA